MSGTVTKESREKNRETPAEALARIQSMKFGGNDIHVIQAFAAAGIPPDEIDPRFNVLTFRAWKAKGRRIAKGAKSIGVTVWIPMRGKKGEQADDATDSDKKDGEKKTFSGMRPKLTRLFHLWQTVPADAPKGTRPKAWDNPDLVREGTYEGVDEQPAAPVAHVPQWMADAFGFEEKPGHVVITPEPLATLLDKAPPGGWTEADKVQPGIDHLGKRSSREREAVGDCSCPAVGIVTNVDCPIHGGR